MDTGIADEIIPVETSETKSLLYLLGASSGIERGLVSGPFFGLGLRVE
jgi:hypothetical protein